MTIEYYKIFIVDEFKRQNRNPRYAYTTKLVRCRDGKWVVSCNHFDPINLQRETDSLWIRESVAHQRKVEFDTVEALREFCIANGISWDEEVDTTKNM